MCFVSPVRLESRVQRGKGGERAGEVGKAGCERSLPRPFDVTQREQKVTESHRKSLGKNWLICVCFCFF